MTIRNLYKQALWLVLAICAFGVPAVAQLQFSGQINSNTLGTTVTIANPVLYNETITAVTVSTTGNLSCSAYPQITFFDTRGITQTVLGFVVTGTGSSWTAAPSLTSVQVGDVITAQLSANGVSCTNELPLTVSFTAQYTANFAIDLTNVASGVSVTNAFVRFRLQGCGTNNPTIAGRSIVLAYQQDFKANSAGIASGTVYGNDKILCDGMASTVYEVSYYVNQIQVGVPEDYDICTIFPGAGGCSNSSLSFDPSTATAIGPAAPPATSPFGYVYSQNLGSQTVVQPYPSSLSIFGAFNVTQITPEIYTIGAGPNQLLTTFAVGTWVNVGDAHGFGDCTVGGGTTLQQCMWNGTTFTPFGSGAALSVAGNQGETQINSNSVLGASTASLDATAFYGSGDACEAVNAAMTAAAAEGISAVDARGFTPTQLTVGCSETLAVPTNMKLSIDGVWTFNANPGMSAASNSEVAGGGIGQTLFQYTGSGTFFSTASTVVNQSVHDASISIGLAASIGLKLEGGYPRFYYNLNVSGAGNGLSGCGAPTQIMFDLTGDGSSSESGSAYFHDILANQWCGTFFQIDHTQQPLFARITAAGQLDNLTSVCFHVDTGAASVGWTDVDCENAGLHGLWFSDLSLGGAYGNGPVFPTSHNFESDDSSGGEGIYFDASLDTGINPQPLRGKFVNTWSAGSGLYSTGSVATAHAANIGIDGGNTFDIDINRVRNGAGCGVRLGNRSTVTNLTGNIQISGGSINSNNVENDTTNLYESAVCAYANVSGLNLHDFMAGNLADGNGHQFYAFIATNNTGGYAGMSARNIESANDQCSGVSPNGNCANPSISQSYLFLGVGQPPFVENVEDRTSITTQADFPARVSFGIYTNSFGLDSTGKHVQWVPMFGIMTGGAGYYFQDFDVYPSDTNYLWWCYYGFNGVSSSRANTCLDANGLFHAYQGVTVTNGLTADSVTVAGIGAGWTNYGYGTVPGVPASGTTFSMPASGVPMVVVWPGALPTGTSQTFNVTGITGSTISLGWGASGGGGGMVYPGAGVPCSNGSAWCTSYALGTSANDLVQLNGSGFFPAINGSLLTGITFTQLVGSLAHGQLPTLLSGDIPNNAANTTGNSATATALAGTPGLCTTGNAPTGILPNGNATGCASITGGGGGVGGSGTVGRLPAFVTNTTTLGNSHIDDGITTSGVVTSTEPVAAPSISVQTSSSTAGFTDPGVTADPSALAVGNRWFRSDLARLSNYDGANVQRGSQLHDFDSFMWPTTGSQRSMVGALETMFFNSASPNSVAVDGDSIYAGIATGGGPTINVITDRVREVLQLRGDAGPGIVNVCTVFGSCQKSTLPPGTTWTPAGSLTYEFNGTGTPIGIATQDVYNTTAADTSAGGTMTCSECTVMVAMFEGLNTLGTGTCTFDGSATGACSGGFTTVTGSSTPSLITLTLTAASGIPASHTFVWHDATGTVRFLGLIATTNRQGATVFNNAIGSSTAAEIHGAHSGTYTAMFQSQVALENPDHVIIGSTGINECVAGTTPASYRTSLHSLYGDWLAAAPNASIVFAGGPDASTCTTYAEGLYREQMAEEALADGVPFLDVYGTYSPYTAVRLMCHGATCYQAGIEPHLNLAAGDAVALSIVDKITDPAADPHTGGASLVMQSHGALQECYQPGLGPPAQYYGSVQTSSGCIKASTANATAGLPIRPCEYNCAGTSGTGTALIGISGWQTVMFDSTSATYGHWVTPSTATAGEYTDTGSVTFPAPPGSGCLYVAGQVELVPASVPGIGKIDTTNAQQICATGSGSGITYAATPTANTVLTSASSSTAGAVAPNPLIDSTGRMIMPGNGTNAGQIDMIIGACQGVTAGSVGICAPNAGSGYVVKLPSAGPVTGLWYATSSAGTVQMSAVTALPSGITGANLTGVPLTTGVTGILPPANGGNGVANTATDTLGTSNQNWGTLATGIVFNTTTTGAQTIVTVGSGLSLTGSTLTASASAPLWSGMGNPTANLTLSMGSNLSEFDTTTALSQFVSWKNKTAAVVGTSQGSPVNVLCGRAWHGSADVEDCLTLSELPGNGNDAAIAFNIGHTGTSTGTVTTNFPGPIAAGVSGGVGGTLTLPEGTAPTGIASSDLIYADSTAHRAKQIANNGTAAQLVNSGADINTSDQVTVTHLASPLPIAQGGTATGSPALVAGTNVTITGTWPNQTINSSGGGGGSSGSLWAVAQQTGGYTLVGTDFTTGSAQGTCNVLTGSTASTFTLPSTAPTTNGATACIFNNSSAWLTLSPNGLNINGGSGSLTIGPATGFDVVSDGTNYWTKGKKKISPDDVGPSIYAAAGGTANAQTLSPPSCPKAYSAGMEFDFLPVAANTTTTPTLNVCSLGAVTMTKLGTTALANSDLTTTAIAKVICDASCAHLQLQNPQTTSGGGNGFPSSGTPNAVVTDTGSTSGQDSGVTATSAGLITVPNAGGIANYPYAPIVNTAETTDKLTSSGAFQYFSMSSGAAVIPANTIVAGKRFRINYIIDLTNGATTGNVQYKPVLCTVAGCGSGTVIVLGLTSQGGDGGQTNASINRNGFVECMGTAAAGSAVTIICGQEAYFMAAGVVSTASQSQSAIIVSVPTNGALYVNLGVNQVTESGSYVSMLANWTNWDN